MDLRATFGRGSCYQPLKMSIEAQQNSFQDEPPQPDSLTVITNEAKRGYKGSAFTRNPFLTDLDLFEQSTVNEDMLLNYPFCSFGGIYDTDQKLLTVCCMVSKNKAITSCHSITDSDPSQLTFKSFVKLSTGENLTCNIKTIQLNSQFSSIESTVEYDFAVIELCENVGETLGYLGLLANARSDDFDIQSASKPIILLTYDTDKSAVEYHTTLAMDVTYNYLTVFNVVNADTIAIVNDSDYGYAVVGVSSKATLRQTVFNTLNHEKFDTVFAWIDQGQTNSPVISKARKYLENKQKLQSKLIVGRDEDSREKECAHWAGISSIVRVNNNCFASVCYEGYIKIWNWKSGEELCLLQLPEEIDFEGQPVQKSSNNTNPRTVATLGMSGEFLLCLTSNSLVYFNWLTRRLEATVTASGVQPENSIFTCMCILSNDMVVLVGSSDNKIYEFLYAQSESRFVFSRMLIDFSSIEQGDISGVTEIVQSSPDLILVGFKSGSVLALENSVDSRVLVESKQSGQPVSRILLYKETKKMAVVLQNKVQVYDVECTDDNLVKQQEEAVMSVGFMKGYLRGGQNQQEVAVGAADEVLPKQVIVNAKQSKKESGRIERVTLNQEINGDKDIHAACVLNEVEIGLSWDNSIQIASIINGQRDSFTKDTDEIVAVSMLNSEGYITGDKGGKVRAWIIGFSSPQLQPVPAPLNHLDIIDELSELSEDKSQPQQSHRSMNLQEQDDVQQIERTNSSTSSVQLDSALVDAGNFMKDKSSRGNHVPRIQVDDDQLLDPIKPAVIMLKGRGSLQGKDDSGSRAAAATAVGTSIAAASSSNAEVAVISKNEQILQWKFEDAQKEIKDLKAKDKQNKTELAKAAEIIAILSQDNAELKKEKEMLSEKIEQSDILLKAEQKKNESLRENSDFLSSKLSDQAKIFEEEKTKILQASKKREASLDHELKAAQAELEHQRKEVESLRKQGDALRKETDNLRKETDHLRKESEPKDEIIQSLRRDLTNARNAATNAATHTLPMAKQVESFIQPPKDYNNHINQVNSNNNTSTSRQLLDTSVNSAKQQPLENHTNTNNNNASNHASTIPTVTVTAAVANLESNRRRTYTSTQPQKAQLTIYTTPTTARQSISNGYPLAKPIEDFSSSAKRIQSQQRLSYQQMPSHNTTYTADSSFDQVQHYRGYSYQQDQYVRELDSRTLARHFEFSPSVPVSQGSFFNTHTSSSSVKPLASAQLASHLIQQQHSTSSQNNLILAYDRATLLNNQYKTPTRSTDTLLSNQRITPQTTGFGKTFNVPDQHGVSQYSFTTQSNVNESNKSTPFLQLTTPPKSAQGYSTSKSPYNTISSVGANHSLSRSNNNHLIGGGTATGQQQIKLLGDDKRYPTYQTNNLTPRRSLNTHSFNN